ncbi:STAS domain-containing protein [Actinacidiphila paucisporea]|uniref:Anti-sigma factor antagonist n=1 Tax=Actinacidiphila paucisporea TaxID=310782 RepID=A0A1M7NZH9_9ACTN|nr:STAS domain-containing protein [Actinacidiphila paucisporea]SHN09507.1 anti-anti-sigma factor [Actinacidiphila paucisporea]
MIGPSSFRVDVALDTDVHRLRLVGELDLDGAADLRSALAACFARPSGRVVLDLWGLRFCDCAGLNVLLEAKDTADSIGTELCVEGACAQVSRLFALTGAGGRFTAGVRSRLPRIA